MRRAALCLVALGFLLTSGASLAQIGDPTAVGPFAVTNAEYDFPLTTIPNVSYPVDVWAVAWYPTDLSAGPYPMVFFLHGNHGICRGSGFDDCPPVPPICPSGTTPTPNHRGYDYVAERLASWGYVVVSINGNANNCGDDGIPEGGRLVQEHLRRWAGWNASGGAAPFGAQFVGKVDLRNIGLVGHSRGGEAMRAAYEYNREDGSPFGIKALFEIAPVDFGAFGVHQVFDANDVAFSVLLPYCDGDVSDLQGMRVFDRAQTFLETNPTPKAQQMIWGANHDFFNSEWEDEAPTCVDQVRLTREEQEQVGRTYVMGFMRTVLGGEDFVDLFTHDQPPPGLPGRVDTAYTESPSTITYVTDFSNGGYSSVNPGVGNVPCVGSACGGTWYHAASKHAVRLFWPYPNGTISVEAGPGGDLRDMTDSAVLSFRVAEAVTASSPNPVFPNGQDFTVSLVDGHGDTSARLHAADFAFIHTPIGPLSPMSVLETVRIPIEQLTGVDLRVVRRINFTFDREPTGSIFLTDVALSPLPRRPVDEMTCTTARASSFAPVVGVHTVGELGDTFYDVLRPTGLCNPTDTTGARIGNAEVWLERYAVRPSAGTPHFRRRQFIRVRDQLGQMVVDLVRPRTMLVSTAQSEILSPLPPVPSSHRVDHYLCYKVARSRGAAAFPKGQRTVGVIDEFTAPSKVLVARKPRELCVPVEVNGAPPIDPDMHVTCYVVRPLPPDEARSARVGVQTANVFGAGAVGTGAEDELCLPSRRVSFAP